MKISTKALFKITAIVYGSIFILCIYGQYTCSPNAAIYYRPVTPNVQMK